MSVTTYILNNKIATDRTYQIKSKTAAIKRITCKSNLKNLQTFE